MLLVEAQDQAKEQDLDDVDQRHRQEEQRPRHPSERRQGLSPELIPGRGLMVLMDVAAGEIQHGQMPLSPEALVL